MVFKFVKIFITSDRVKLGLQKLCESTKEVLIYKVTHGQLSTILMDEDMKGQS